jgi:hypothetical protein
MLINFSLESLFSTFLYFFLDKALFNLAIDKLSYTRSIAISASFSRIVETISRALFRASLLEGLSNSYPIRILLMVFGYNRILFWTLSSLVNRDLSEISIFLGQIPAFLKPT